VGRKGKERNGKARQGDFLVLVIRLTIHSRRRMGWDGMVCSTHHGIAERSGAFVMHFFFLSLTAYTYTRQLR